MSKPADPPPGLLHRSHHSMKVGDVHRFVITYVPEKDEQLGESLFVRVKNAETVLLRPNVLSGPFMFYCDIAPAEFDNRQRCFITADQPHYNPTIMPGQSIKTELSLHTLKERYVFIVNVSSQIVFNTSSEVNFELILCRKVDQLHKRYYGDHFGSFCQNLDVQHFSTVDLWNQPPLFLPSESKPIHLVILTHGMYSNTTADMLYIKERIEEMCSKTGENVVVRGYAANVCRTERGVKYLGRRLAEWIVKTAVPELGHVSKISFIAHSLGGLVQSFAIAYIQHNYPKFFETIQPENFITMASPLLGISNDNPAYVKFFLSFGIVGKTGQDLGLQGSKPLLLLLPSRSTRKVLQRFKRRTVYANVLNDGIVPLRTGALMFLDWNGLCEVYDALKSSGSLNPSFNDLKETSSAENQVGEIPANMEQQEEGEAQDASEGVIPDAAGIEVEAESNDDSSDGGLLGSIKTTLQSWMSSFQSPTTTIKVRKIKRYQRYQTMTAGDEDPVDDNWDADDDNDVSKFESVTPIPKTNVISGIGRVLLPPAPTSEFLLDPSTRQNFILHDRIYRPSMIPRQKLKKSDSFIKGLDIIGRRKHLQEKIARKWHRGMSWRKVLVNLPPDAHNNIMVRRNFANAYGWPVVDHLVENHFGLKCFKGEDLEDFALRPEDEVADSEDYDNDIKQLEDKMSKLLDVEHDKSVKEREKVEQQGKIAKHGPRNDSPELAPPPPIGNVAEDLEIPKRALSRDSEDEDDSWINDSSSLCYDGPAGMLNTIPEKVNDQVEAFKRTIFPEEEDGAPAIGPVKPDSKADGEDVRDIYVNDPTQMINTYP